MGHRRLPRLPPFRGRACSRSLQSDLCEPPAGPSITLRSPILQLHRTQSTAGNTEGQDTRRPPGCRKTEDDDTDPVPKFVTEVKRASAPNSQINADLARLAAARRLSPRIRAFLFLISEANLPSRFVHEEGRSLTGEKRIARLLPGKANMESRTRLPKTATRTKCVLIEVYAGRS